MKHVPLVDIEINVDIKALAAKIIVRSTSKERFVRDQLGDASELAHDIQERLRTNIFVEGPVEGAYTGDLFNDGFAANHPMFIQRMLFIESGEIAEKCFAIVR